MQTAVPEAMCLCSENDENLRGLLDFSSYSAIGIGPGVGTREETAQVLKLLIQESKVPLVIDADGLNILSENKTWLSFIPQGSVLTPHPGEFRRLFGDFKSDEARLEGLRELAHKHQIVIVLKGAHTAVAWPNGKVYFNSTGNPGMATAGSGDVLTGVILSFLAQGFRPELAASLAVFYHGLAGDLAAQEMGEMGITASDIVEALPYALP
jgi:NAD(P)H-hydrate epimerase